MVLKFTRRRHDGRRRTIRSRVATTTLLIVLALLFGAVGTASVTSVAAAATPPTSDGALHFLPPLNNGPTGDPARADSSLLDSVDVLYCKVTATGCAAIGAANSALPGVDLLVLLGGVYTTAFSGTAHGVNNGDTIRITVRVAGLSLGTTALTADILTLLPSATRFNPLVPLTVSFRIDRNPVIRTRYLHDHGASATEVAGVLRTVFGLDDATAATVLYDDVRVGDVSTMARTVAAGTAVPNRTPYGVQDLVDAVSAASTYGDNATRTAQVLVGKFANQDIVDAIGASPNLNADAAQLLDAIQNGLGVTDPQQQVDLLANAKLANGSPMLTPEQILAAEVAKNGPLTPVQALTLLYNAGYAAGPSMAALQTVEGTGAVDMAAGALQVFGFPISDVTTALGTLYPGSDPAALLTQGGQQLVSQNCAAYGQASSASTVAAILVRAGYAPAAAAALLNSACGFSATQAGTILAAPASGSTPTYGLAAVPAVAALSPVYDPTGVAQALSTVYFPGAPGPQRATDIGQALASGWHGPNPLGVVDLLGGVGHAVQSLAQPGSPVECLASLGAVGGNNSLLDVLRHLDDPSLGGLLPSPFSTGPNGNLAQLGACLITNGIKVPFPLKKITVNEQGVQLSATSLRVPNGVVATRAGWLPTLPGPHIAALNIATLPVFGSAPQDMQGGAFGCIQSICDQHHNLADLTPFASLRAPTRSR